MSTIAERRARPTTAFPPMPDELDDAVYESYLAFIATNLRGWPRRPSSSSASSIRSAPPSRESSGSRSISTPPTPLLRPTPSLGPSTPSRSAISTPGPLTPPTPFPLTPTTPPSPLRGSYPSPSSPSSPSPASKLKHRISGPMRLQFTPRTPNSTVDPFEAAFKASLAKTKAVPSLAPVPGLVVRAEPVLWRRGSGSSTSSALPSVEEDVLAEEAACEASEGGEHKVGADWEEGENVAATTQEVQAARRVPFERAWW